MTAMNGTIRRAATIVAVALMIAAMHKAAVADGGSTTHCQDVANGVIRVVNQCWFFAQNENDPFVNQKRQICNRLENDAQAMIQWCNRNIQRCKQNYVSWHLDGNTTTGTDRRINCVYGTR